MIVLISSIYFIYVLAKLYISTMEIGFVKKSMGQEPVVLDAKAFLEAGKYKITNERFGIVRTLFEYALFLVWIGGGLVWLERLLGTGGTIYESTLFIFTFVGINYFLSLPFDIYATFIKDKKFSNISAKTYILDQIKGALLFVILGGAVILAITWIIGNLPLWWMWGFLIIFSVIIFINMIYPNFIAPLFNAFTPLKDEVLKERIESLLAKANLHSDGVFTVDASKRDKRLNAYFGGLGKSKRVVLYDTLVEKLSQDELLAVLGHELGHFKHKDIFKNIIASGIMLGVMFGIFGNLPISVFNAVGIEVSAHAILALFFLLSPIVSFIWMPFFGYMSRSNEYKADEYGSECQSKNALKNALMKLADANKSFPLSHPLSIIFYHTHPPLVERLKRLS